MLCDGISILIMGFAVIFVQKSITPVPCSFAKPFLRAIPAVYPFARTCTRVHADKTITPKHLGNNVLLHHAYVIDAAQVQQWSE